MCVKEHMKRSLKLEHNKSSFVVQTFYAFAICQKMKYSTSHYIRKMLFNCKMI